MEIEHLFRYYNITEVSNFKIIDSSRSLNDKRIAIIVEDKYVGKFVIKLANNVFTTKERIEGWEKLVDVYRSIGLYSPKFIRTDTGELSCVVFLDGQQYLMYCEEYKKYPTLDELEIINNRDEIYISVLEFIGVIASKSKELVPWNTAYSLYDSFCKDYLYDENYENALSFYKLAKIKLQKFEDEVERIWNLYIFKRNNFQDTYRQLPEAVFQGDLNDSNILVNDRYEFVGLIDYNLSGTEKIINYMLSEVVETPSEKSYLPKLIDEHFLEEADNLTRFRLSLACKHYRLNNQELESLSTLYNIVVPFRWPTVCLFKWAINNDKSEFYENILNWIYYQLSRNFTL